MTRVGVRFVFRFAFGVVLLTMSLCRGVSAQQQQPPQCAPQQAEARPPAARPTPARREEANTDLSITARVTADSLCFEKVPNTRVEFTGKPARETVWEAERENLPRPVQPGVTYRNVGITLRITSVFADIDRIVAEALGEVPVNDEAPPAPAQPAPAPPERPAAATPPSSTSPPAKAAVNTPRRRPAPKGRGN